MSAYKIINATWNRVTYTLEGPYCECCAQQQVDFYKKYDPDAQMEALNDDEVDRDAECVDCDQPIFMEGSEDAMIGQFVGFLNAALQNAESAEL